MEFIQGGEWAIVAFSAVTIIACLCILVSVQGDLKPEKRGVNTIEQETAMIIDLLKKTRRTIQIYDDGNDFESSAYNSANVIEAMRDCLDRGVTIRCLFNGKSQSLKILELVELGIYDDRIKVNYLRGKRADPDTYYKIVDGGRFVHLSNHSLEYKEREFRLRDASGWWEVMTRKRISKRYSDLFENGVINSVQTML